MRTHIYIDGFNFYYGCVKGTPYKWLDFMALFKRILRPHHQILRINYFTALVSDTQSDPNKTFRQKAFIKALETHIPEIRVHYGFFLKHTKKAPLANPTPSRRSDTFINTEEKGSDVNLAVHLIREAWLNLYDCAIVVSNDSDLTEALRVVKQDFNKTIGLCTPGEQRRTSKELALYADFVRTVRTRALASSQLPDPIPGTKIFKPPTW